MTQPERPVGTQRRIPAGSFESVDGPNYALPGVPRLAPPRPPRIPPPLLFGVLLVLLLGAGGFLLLSSRTATDDLTADELNALVRAQDQTVRTEAVPVEPGGSAALDVETQPDGAAVTFDEAFVGRTPLQRDRLEARWYVVSVRKEGYQPVDTLVHLRPEARALLSLTLSPSDLDDAGLEDAGFAARDEPAVEPVARRAEPVPAPRPAQRTPAASPAPPAPAEASGQQGVVETQTSPSEAAQEGTLRIVAVPWGSIYIDGALHARDTDLRYEVDLPAGTHRVRVQHPSLGTWERTVEIAPGRPTSLTADLN